jgi:hypothetical protein
MLPGALTPRLVEEDVLLAYQTVLEWGIEHLEPLFLT